jgi:ribulose 1,5-bisphosphate carboxylase large subunit-like protein
MKFFRTKNEINLEKYIIATYFLSSSESLKDAAWNIAIGQSVGNPNIRNKWETDELFENHSCIILENEAFLNYKKDGYVEIAFPIINTDWDTDGISHFLCQLMGGHVDIDLITKCRLIKLELPIAVKDHFLGPKFGLSGFRKLVGRYDKPLFGSIIKPKTGITPPILLSMVKQLVDGGVDFIKEDEILSNPHFCRLEDRIDIISNYLAKQSRKIVYCHTINADPHCIVDRVKLVAELGGNGVHVNIWSGLGVYNSIRKLDLPIFLHFQKSGDKVFTDISHRFSIAWPVICQLATLMGVDSIQTGMLGGYSNDDEQEVNASIKILRGGNSTPVLSCGMHPGLIDSITEKVGVDYMANVGGAIHGHPKGTNAGALAMRQAIDKNHSDEYYQAIHKWGLVK